MENSYNMHATVPKAVREPYLFKRSAPQKVTWEPGWRMASPTYGKQ